MGSKEIVCWENVLRYHSNTPDLINHYKQIMESRRCPLCPENFFNKIVGGTNGWILSLNPWPYQNTETHLLISPKEHIACIEKIIPEDWLEIQSLISIAKFKFPVFKTGGGLAIRFGSNSGTTLYHLHFHLIAPKTSKVEEVFPGQYVYVNFPIG